MRRGARPYLDRLADIPVFSACSRREVALIARSAEDVIVPAGREIITEGERGREFFVILAGTATVTRRGEELAILGPGDYFGELSLLGDTARNATITATSDLEVLVFERRHFLGTLAEAPSLARKLLVGTVRRLHEADTRAGLAAAV